MAEEHPIVAVLGKGGVGKTVISALAARAMLDSGRIEPILLVDADPMMGLASAIGRKPETTLGQVRDRVVDTIRGETEGKSEVASRLDYWLLESLAEGDRYALMVMGRARDGERGCFCPVNTLLRQAIDLVIDPFSAVLIDAEAGVEQVRREVTRRVSVALVVVDGSLRAHDTLVALRDMLPPHATIAAVENRCRPTDRELELPKAIPLVASIPDDAELREFDREGRSLWELPRDNAAVRAARPLVDVFCGRSES